MSTKPKVVKIVASTFAQYVREVDVYDNVLEKIEGKHPEEFGRLDEVYQTIENSATHIHASKTNSTSIVLVNESVVSSAGDPLRVPVKVYDDGRGIMTSAYYSTSSDQGPLLWSKEAGVVVPEFKGRKREGTE